MAGFGSIQKELKKIKKKKEKEKHNKALSFILWKKNPFFKKKRASKASKAIKGLKLNWKRALNYKWYLCLIKILIQ